MTPEQIKAYSDRIIDILPDDTRDALSVMALSFACVVVSTRCPDEAAIKAFRIALSQMHAGLDHLVTQ